jgi:hypothetical protein
MIKKMLHNHHTFCSVVRRRQLNDWQARLFFSRMILECTIFANFLQRHVRRISRGRVFSIQGFFHAGSIMSLHKPAASRFSPHKSFLLAFTVLSFGAPMVAEASPAQKIGFQIIDQPPVVIEGRAGSAASASPQAPVSTGPSSGMTPSLAAEQVVEGFADKVPLSVAMQQILPQGYGYTLGDGIDPGQLVSWRGGRPWNVVMQEMLAPTGLSSNVNGRSVTVSSSASSPTIIGGGSSPNTMARNDVAVQPPQQLLTPQQVISPQAASAMQPLPPLPPLPQQQPGYPPQAQPYTPQIQQTYDPVVAQQQMQMQQPMPPQYQYQPMVQAPSYAPQTAGYPDPMMQMQQMQQPMATAPIAQPPQPAPMMMPPSQQGGYPQPVMDPMQGQPPQPYGAQPYPSAPGQPQAMTQPMMNAPAPMPPSAAPDAGNQPLQIESPMVFIPQTWEARPGHTLRSLLQEWCARANVELQWIAEYDYPVMASMNMTGTFEEAVRTLLSGFGAAKPTPRARLHYNPAAGQSILIVEATGNNYGD